MVYIYVKSSNICILLTCLSPLVSDGKRLGAGIGGFSLTPINGGGEGAGRANVFLGIYRGISLCKPFAANFEFITEE